MTGFSVRYDLADAEGIGAAIGAALAAGDVVLLSGDLGAGKTTLARAMLKARGLAGEAPSPTFAIVQPYAPPETDLPIAHVDLYRIEDADELIELGLDDYLYDGALLIEWPERLGGEGWPGALLLRISGAGDARVLTAAVPTSWGSRWPLR
ncbi:tRNA (adenosine(37)-N6)-threonylcarbamoyltransferase complex ATPase subunit type 1 TsaE [Sphingopyxis sp. SE2]|jgi:tRNA threonylcarbamoyladenosine biosynthesis protein TsaE|uniref:tRNA (adenosine(37)-N6)-threonylcarbamoyltransferase complex ATPase subunit type 1 TsaE n=1 Tax=unclassified Sphingopyxis TaxID=2614943 RepID=UPI00050FDEEC|nr:MULTISPECIES: tRNA (adenosine(37)-N6)-threonylcarbamoyltransferase complex ATPase subunit type 1 TsaE [unclassified Sphingopyxis]KGB57881.1 ATPase [Sphingopyxis sp. LC363]MDT7530795.1 tRNA (adenosine(37)-N6)-threonylcarbamoyltransferase complex ATPase subunit type 1 TsaE [Sphingopyxis sp. SE2]